jgi:hypothetical protein
MKKIFASLTLAAFMLGATAFAYAQAPEAKPMTKMSHKKKGKHKKHHAAAPSATTPSATTPTTPKKK